MCKKGGRCKTTNQTMQSTGGFFVCDCRKTNYTGIFCQEHTDYKPLKPIMKQIGPNSVTTTTAKTTTKLQQPNSSSPNKKLGKIFIVMLVFLQFRLFA